MRAPQSPQPCRHRDLGSGLRVGTAGLLHQHGHTRVDGEIGLSRGRSPRPFVLGLAPGSAPDSFEATERRTGQGSVRGRVLPESGLHGVRGDYSQRVQ